MGELIKSFKRFVGHIAEMGSFVIRAVFVLITLIGAGFFGYLFMEGVAESTDDTAWVPILIFGPPAVCFGILFLISLIWLLDYLKEWSKNS